MTAFQLAGSVIVGVTIAALCVIETRAELRAARVARRMRQ